MKSGGIPNALWDMYNGLMRLGDQSLRASLLFMAAGFFCRAITSSGSDVENLMAALGGKGLSARITLPLPLTLYRTLTLNLMANPDSEFVSCLSKV